MMLITKTSDQTRQRGHTLSTQHSLKPLAPCACLATYFLLSRSFELTSTEPMISCLRFFLLPPKSPPFSITSTTLRSSGVSCEYSLLFRPLRSCPSPPVPGLWFFAWCDGFVGTSGLKAMVAGYSLASPHLSRLPTLSPLSPLLPRGRFPGSLSPSPSSLVLEAGSARRWRAQLIAG